MDISNGADVAIANPAVIKKLSDLKGKKILITNIPLGVYMLGRLLDKANLKPSDVTVTQSPEDKHPKIYKENKADAVITFDPFASEITKMGGKIIFDSSEIPNEIFDVLMVKEELYQKRKAELCDLGKQWFKVMDYIKNQNDLASEKIGKRMGTTAQDYKNMMKGLTIPDRQLQEKLFTGKTPLILNAAEKLAATMIKEKVIKNIPDFKSLIDPDFLECTK